jgi:hypothetical protein
MDVTCSDAEWDDSQGMIAEGYRDSALWVPSFKVHMVSPQADHHSYYHRTVLGEYCSLEMEE